MPARAAGSSPARRWRYRGRSGPKRLLPAVDLLGELAASKEGTASERVELAASKEGMVSECVELAASGDGSMTVMWSWRLAGQAP